MPKLEHLRQLESIVEQWDRYGLKAVCHTLRYCQPRQQLRKQPPRTVSNPGSAVQECYIAVYRAGQWGGREWSEWIGGSMSVSADGYTASRDNYLASTNCHHHRTSGDGNDYPLGPDRNNYHYCNTANTDNDGDSMDDNYSESGSKLSKSW